MRVRKVHVIGAAVLAAGIALYGVPGFTFDAGVEVAQGSPIHGVPATPAEPAAEVAAGPSPALNDGIYTAEQAERAWDPYIAECAQCHGNTLRGTPGAPRIVGSAFRNNWEGRSVAEFYDWVHANMPAGRGGQLQVSVYADLVALILQENGYPAGETEFDPADESLVDVIFTDPPPAQ